ncbi:MAG TPA: hypothetical protein VLG46_11425 [Anaerolineae bacterium]|nr:hypothetical protein [Anaerolineae bacterium]
MSQTYHLLNCLESQGDIAGIAQEGLAQLQAQLDELPPDQIFNRLGLEFRVQPLTSVITWLGTCKAQLHFEH